MKLKDIQINEYRAPKTYDFVTKLKQHPMVEDIVRFHSLPDGMSAFVRTTDGNAYEVIVRPASLAKGHEEVRGKKSDL